MRQLALLPALGLALCPVSAVAATSCLSDAAIEAALGDQVRAKAFFIDSRALPNIPLCSGLTLAQQIQRMRAAAFPEEQTRAESQQAELIARDRARAAPQPATTDIAQPVTRRTIVRLAPVVRVTAPARPVRARKAVRSTRPAAAVSSRSSQRAFSSCREARAAGAAPIRRGQAGYSGRLDRDGDGVACE
jgi:hypothetical protein